MVPTIQPYQAPGGGFGHHAGGDASKGKRRDKWDQTAAIGVAVWFGGWLLGYGIFWPLYLALDILSGFTPFGSLFDALWARGAPVVDVYPAASELRIPAGQVSRYVDSYVQNYGDAALIFASHDGYAQLVSGLLTSKDLGYSELVDAADESGHTALLYAAGRGFPQVAAALLRSGADPDAPRQGKNGGGLTPLMQAAGSGHREVVGYLLQANATADARDDSGNTALMYAAYAGQLGTLQELLQRGAMRDLKNSRGETALSFAVTNRHQAVADALQRGARPVVEGRRSRSASLATGETKPAAARLGGSKGDSRKVAAKEEEASGGGVSSLLSSLSGMAGGGDGKQSADAGPTGTASAATEKKVRQLEGEILELKRAQEAAELKSQRRIVDLLEQSSDKQKLLDDSEKERRELRQQVDEMSAKLRQRESQGQEDEERSTRLSKEAHDARMEAERERTRADSAERERERQTTEVRLLREEADRRKREVADRTAEVDRLYEQIRALKANADRIEDERKALQRQLSALRGAGESRPPPVVASHGPPTVDRTAIAESGVADSKAGAQGAAETNSPALSLLPPAADPLVSAEAAPLEVGVDPSGMLGGATNHDAGSGATGAASSLEQAAALSQGETRTES